ncbi:MAG: sn-glycerol-3-phosphate ABC transporter ATP-binding protein UgpC [Desulfobacteraceae bacterium]|jgi:multiple sugar transport system ATP-binding protein
MAQVILQNVKKKFGETQVIHGIDMEIEDNEFAVFVGPSGCGKSTILRMIAGLENVSEGTIFIGDKEVKDLPPNERNIAMVFQDYALYPHMTVFDNIAFSLKLAKKKKQEIKQRVLEAADILGIEPLLKRKPADLSGGQRQRVAMGRAIIRKPQVFLFDEPLSNLDAQLRTTMRMEIKKLHMRLKATTIYVTHDQVEAMTLADRIFVLKDGDLKQAGSPVDIYEKPENAFVGRFIGNPPMNIFKATVQNNNDAVFLEINKFKFPIPQKKYPSLKNGAKVLVGIRPKAIHLAKYADNMPDDWKFDGRIILSEILGGESLVEIDLGEETIIAEIQGRFDAIADEKIKFCFDFNQLHIFDQKSMERLG